MHFIVKRASWGFDKNSLALISLVGGSALSGCRWILAGGWLLPASLGRAFYPGMEEWRASDHLLWENAITRSSRQHLSFPIEMSLFEQHSCICAHVPGHSLQSISGYYCWITGLFSNDNPLSCQAWLYLPSDAHGFQVHDQPSSLLFTLIDHILVQHIF